MTFRGNILRCRRPYIVFRVTEKENERKKEQERERERKREKEKEKEMCTKNDENREPTLHSPFETGSDTGRFR